MAYSSSSDGLNARDLEQNDGHNFLMNNSVQSFSWNDLTVTVKDRRTKQPRNLIENINGSVQQGACRTLHLTFLSIHPYARPGGINAPWRRCTYT